MKYIIFNADDYGYRPDISKGIIQSFTDGFLTSTTAMTTHITDYDIEVAKQNDKLGYGLHLNLTAGTALSENWRSKYGEFTRPKLYQPGQFDRDLLIEYFNQFDSEDVFAEYEAQYNKFVELFGKKPTHIDSHLYTSSFPTTFPAFLKLAKKYGLNVRGQAMYDIAEKQKHEFGDIAHMNNLNEELKTNGVKSTNYFSLIYPYRENDPIQTIKNELQKIKDGESIEFSVHPGLEQDFRKKDLAVMLDKKLGELLELEGGKLITFADL